MTRVNKKCFQLNLGLKRTSRKHFSASAFISRSRPSALTSKMALASKTFSLMSFFNLGFNWKKFLFTLVPFFLTVFYNNFDNKILILVKTHNLKFYWYNNQILASFWDLGHITMYETISLLKHHQNWWIDEYDWSKLKFKSQFARFQICWNT